MPRAFRDTKKGRALEVLNHLMKGPSSLYRPPAQGLGYPGSGSLEEYRAKLHADYLLWVNSWVVPQLLELVPELAKAPLDMGRIRERAAREMGQDQPRAPHDCMANLEPTDHDLISRCKVCGREYA